MINLSLLKARISCVAYAQSDMHLPIRKSGDRCVSPFRANAKNKNSFRVSDVFWCDYGDGASGDIIDMCAMHRHNGDRGRAIYDLAARLGITNNDEAFYQWKQATQHKCNTIQTWHENLRPSDIDYLHGRRINDDTIKALKIGYDHGRIIIPSFRNGYTYSWCGRAMNGQEPKYFKPANDDFTEQFPWGMNTLDRDGDTLYIAEGCFDALSIYQSGYPVIATLGGHFGRSVLPTVISICRDYKNVILTFDNDDGGRKFTQELGKALFNSRVKFSVADIPTQYKDISDYYTDNNEIKDLKTHDGYVHLAQNIPNKDDFRQFAFKAARILDKPTIAALFASAQGREDFGTDWLKAVRVDVYRCPPEPVIIREIFAAHQLLYVDNVGFYEYFPTLGKWTLLSDQTVHGYISDALGTFAAGNKLTPIKNLMKPEILATQPFDREPLVNFINGTLDLKTGDFRDASPNDMCSIQLPYTYEPDAKCTAWDKFIAEVSNGDEKRMELLQFIAGYTLFQDCPHEKIFVLTGSGGNGKSRYTMILQKLFGEENVTNIKPLGLVEPFEVIHLKDSMLNIAGEIVADLSKTEERLKEIASGETIQGCYKGKDFIRFNPRSKLVFCCNNQLRSSDTSDGLARRLVIVDFPCKFVEQPDPADPLQKLIDIDLMPKLLVELSGIFNWAYEGYKLLKRVGYFTLTDEHKDLMRQFKEASNPVLVFFNEMVDDGLPNSIFRQMLYERYRQWCIDSGHKPLANNKFHPEFQRVAKGVYNVVERSVRIGSQPRRERKYELIVNEKEGSQTGENVVRLSRQKLDEIPDWVKEMENL